MNNREIKEQLMLLFQSAVDSASPDLCLPPFLPEMPEKGRLIILGAGKGSAALVCAVESHYRSQGALEALSGFAVTRHGFTLPTAIISLIEAGHPVPDDNSVAAAAKGLEMARDAGEEDTVLVLMSGGASALWAAPVKGVTLSEKQELTRAMLASGAPISEINCVRKHLSRIKGGRLARAAYPAMLITLAVSDVPGDDPSAIGSGPTVGDPTTLADAREILKRRGITPLPAIAAALENPDNETPQPDDPLFTTSRFDIVARPGGALSAASEVAKERGYEPRILGDALEGVSSDLGRHHGELALAAKAQGEKIALLSGGETTVLVRGSGRGGPNQEYALSLAITLDGEAGICALAADTDGIDGGSGDAGDPAGAIVDETTLSRANKNSLEPAQFLENNDSTGFFTALDDLVITGPTHTNVNDFRVILVNP